MPLYRICLPKITGRWHNASSKGRLNNTKMVSVRWPSAVHHNAASVCNFCHDLSHHFTLREQLRILVWNNYTPSAVIRIFNDHFFALACWWLIDAFGLNDECNSHDKLTSKNQTTTSIIWHNPYLNNKIISSIWQGKRGNIKKRLVKQAVTIF